MIWKCQALSFLPIKCVCSIVMLLFIVDVLVCELECIYSSPCSYLPDVVTFWSENASFFYHAC